MKARYFIVETRVGTGGGETRARLAIRRRSTRGSAVRVDRRRLDRSRLVKRDCRFLTRASPRLSRLADCFASTDGGRSQRRFVGSIRDIPLFRTALGSTFRPRSAEERPIRRADGPTAEARFSPQASSFENVEKRLKRGKGACNSRRQGDLRNERKNGRRLDFDATTRETLVPQVASRRGVKRSGGRDGTRENRFA